MSPGTLPHTVWAYDVDGLGLVRVDVFSTDSVLAADSTRLPADAFESTLSYVWDVPGGMAPGTGIRIIARVEDLTGLEAADTVDLQVGANPAVRASKQGRN